MKMIEKKLTRSSDSVKGFLFFFGLNSIVYYVLQTMIFVPGPTDQQVQERKHRYLEGPTSLWSFSVVVDLYKPHLPIFRGSQTSK